MCFIIIFGYLQTMCKMKLWLISCVLIIQLFMTKSDFTSESKHWFTIDLFQHIVWNRTCAEQTAIRIPSANTKNTAYFLQDRQRCLEVSKDFLQSTINPIITSSEEITILAAVKQQPLNSGSIISFSTHSQRHFELESSGRRDEIRLHYIHNHRTHTEVFPYQLADNQWHKVALSLTDSFVQLFIDCKKVYERQILPVDLRFIHRKDLQLWIGQRNNKHAFLKGSVEYIKIVSSPQGYLEQCPYADVACPTCSQFRDLDSTVTELYSLVQDLHLKLKSQEARLQQLEQCECKKSCDINGIHYRDGETWQKDHCTKCTCRGGEVQCDKPQCPILNCKHPVLLDGHCCPTCFRQCYHNGEYYEHGESFTSSGRICVTCQCQDGKLSCHQKKEECPLLSCPENQQRLVEGQCCKVCKEENGREPLDYCAKGHNCHPNASCINLSTKYTCKCKTGFLGNEKYCTDVNECDQQGGLRGHHCGSHSTCVNTLGSYRCQCQTGYTQIDHFTCREHNECDTGAHQCAIEAECQNIEGGYECQCMPGYEGDGFACKPVCVKGCQNGGQCVSPGTCQCRKGFYGESCQLDLDECRLGIAKCHPNSECINIPGDYICECRPGYFSNMPDNKNGWLCQDVNECLGYGGGHQCATGTVCHNTDGGYQCVCTGRKNCRNDCYVNGEAVAHDSVWPSTEDVCSVCKCNNGRVDCKPPPCDCSSPQVEYRCCSECKAENRCPHQELDISFYSGDTWTYHCQTCQCINGETDCWRLECPKLNCSPTIQLPGDCCPKCATQVDPCNAPVLKENLNSVCTFESRTYRNGEKWKVDVMNSCSTCVCKGGHVCCSHNQTCDRERRQAVNVRSYTSQPKKGRKEDHTFDGLLYNLANPINKMGSNVNHRQQRGTLNIKYNLFHDTGQNKGRRSNLNNNRNNNNRNDKPETLSNNYNKDITGRDLQQSHQSLSYNRDKTRLYNKRHGGRIRSRGLHSEEQDIEPDWSFRDRG